MKYLLSISISTDRIFCSNCMHYKSCKFYVTPLKFLFMGNANKLTFIHLLFLAITKVKNDGCLL